MTQMPKMFSPALERLHGETGARSDEVNRER
jgi:hypothetical protein